jgi:single-strand DNA-binding protein
MSTHAVDREVTEDLEGQPFKHRIAEIHAIRMKRLSKIEAAGDPSDGAEDQQSYLVDEP